MRVRLAGNARLNLDGAGGGVKVMVFMGALINGLQLAEQDVGIKAIDPRQGRANGGDARLNGRLAHQPVALVARPLARIPGIDGGIGRVAAQDKILTKRLMARAQGLGRLGWGVGRFEGGEGGWHDVSSYFRIEKGIRSYIFEIVKNEKRTYNVYCRNKVEYFSIGDGVWRGGS